MKNKKLFITTALCMCIAPAFADNEPNVDIAANASDVSCDSGVLQTSSGSSTLEADWSANHVRIKWYDGNDEIELSQADSAAAECIYDGTLTLPTPPSKNGYTFAGWKVKSFPQCDLTGLDASIMGSKAAYIEFDGTESTATNSRLTTPSTYNLTEPGQWATEFSYGTIKGVAYCSAKEGSGIYYRYIGNEDRSNWIATENEVKNATGENCWCKMTNYTPKENGVDGETCNASSTYWVLVDYGSPCNQGMCVSYCATFAGFANLGMGPGFRSSLFGIPDTR